MTIEDKIREVFKDFDDSRIEIRRDEEVNDPDDPIIDFEGALSEEVLDRFAKNGLKITYVGAYHKMPGWMMITVKEIK